MTVGLDDLQGLFQSKLFCDSKNCSDSSRRYLEIPVAVILGIMYGFVWSVSAMSGSGHG